MLLDEVSINIVGHRNLYLGKPIMFGFQINSISTFSLVGG